jgi:hypothetical protein
MRATSSASWPCTTGGGYERGLLVHPARAGRRPRALTGRSYTAADARRQAETVAVASRMRLRARRWRAWVSDIFGRCPCGWLIRAGRDLDVAEGPLVSFDDTLRVTG